jgi:hypothetical protein
MWYPRFAPQLGDLHQFYGLFILINDLGGEQGFAPGVPRTPIVVNHLLANPPIVNKSANVAVVSFAFGALSVMKCRHEMVFTGTAPPSRWGAKLRKSQTILNLAVSQRRVFQDGMQLGQGQGLGH